MQDATILAVPAHPDDEGSCGGALAQYAKQGARVFVACATRGDGVDAQIKNDAATRETLGQIRSQELACACEQLGIQPPLFLGYQDGEVDKVPVEDAARGVARLIRELKANILVTHDSLGGYGHPDHIAVSNFVTRAFELAGDMTVDLGTAAFTPAKLYYWAFPRSFMERVPAFRDRRADIRGQQLGFVGVPDEAITTEINVRDWLPTKLAALACHRTQFDLDENGQPKTFAASTPEELRLEMFGHERFILAKSTLAGYALNGAKETDWLAGLG
ncbi:MAG: PIG-L deacetylase family protein [Anaerolineales bacterium]